MLLPCLRRICLSFVMKKKVVDMLRHNNKINAAAQQVFALTTCRIFPAPQHTRHCQA